MQITYTSDIDLKVVGKDVKVSIVNGPVLVQDYYEEDPYEWYASTSRLDYKDIPDHSIIHVQTSRGPVTLEASSTDWEHIKPV